MALAFFVCLLKKYLLESETSEGRQERWRENYVTQIVALIHFEDVKSTVHDVPATRHLST